MTEKLAVLGSTGSVGRQALDVCRHLPIEVTAIAASRDVRTMEEQIREFHPAICAVADEKAASDLALRVADTDTRILAGVHSAEEAASLADCDTVLNAVSGVAGLRPTLSALKAGKNLALANKESLVTFGEGVVSEAKRQGKMILPVDSEHSAIFQCLSGQPIKKILLTASGGPFYGMSRSELVGITPERALSHPTWLMGPRITIDSSTLMNKGFEVIEAVWLFGVMPEQVEVVVHRESIIHSMVEYRDNGIIAQLGSPDMRLCAQYALTYPERYESPVKELDFKTLTRLTFGQPDNSNFPLLPLAFEAIAAGGVTPAAMNGADEEAVSLFLQGKIGYLDIADCVIEATRHAAKIASPTLSDVEDADRFARAYVREMAASLCRTF